MKIFASGDIISMDFNPTKGHEQSGRRPAVVLSNKDYGKLMKIAIVCPITSNMKKFPVHVPLDDRTKTSGCILCEHIRTVDLSKRNAKFIENLPIDIFEKVIDITKSFFE